MVRTLHHPLAVVGCLFLLFLDLLSGFVAPFRLLFLDALAPFFVALAPFFVALAPFLLALLRTVAPSFVETALLRFLRPALRAALHSSAH